MSIMAAPDRRKTSRHPGVVILTPEGRHTWRVRFKNPGTGKLTKESIPDAQRGTPELREAFAVAKSRELAFILGEVGAESVGAGQRVLFVEIPCDQVSTGMHFYVVQIQNVGCKIGITDNPRQRIQCHVAAANAHGRVVSKVWVSARTERAREIEADIQRSACTEYLAEAFNTLVFRAKLLGAKG